MSDVPTAAAERARGTDLGLEGAALDLFVAAGAPARHEHRVNQAADAIRVFAGSTHVQGSPEHTTAQREAAAAIVLGALDAVGVGGRLGTGRGCGTIRHPAFQGLGKGRKFASDGAAWTAAIAAAVERFVPGTSGTHIRPAVTGGEVGLFVATGRHREDMTPVPELWVTLEGCKPLWVAALCRRLVVDAATTGDVGGDLPAVIAGSLTDWGKLLNLAESALETERAAAAPPVAADDSDVEVVRRVNPDEFVHIDAIGVNGEPVRLVAHLPATQKAAFTAGLDAAKMLGAEDVLRARALGEDVVLFARLSGDDVCHVYTLRAGAWIRRPVPGANAGDAGDEVHIIVGNDRW